MFAIAKLFSKAKYQTIDNNSLYYFGVFLVFKALIYHKIESFFLLVGGYSTIKLRRWDHKKALQPVKM